MSIFLLISFRFQQAIIDLENHISRNRCSSIIWSSVGQNEQPTPIIHIFWQSFFWKKYFLLQFIEIKIFLIFDVLCHDDVIKWKHFPRYWPFVRGIHRSPVNSPHKGQWRGALMFCLIRAWINSWVNNCEAGDLRRYLAHCDVIVMYFSGVAFFVGGVYSTEAPWMQ